jgi:hypothetical protein
MGLVEPLNNIMIKYRMSNNQLFKQKVDNKLLFDLLDNIALKSDKCYVLDQNAYKKMLYHSLHMDFYKILEDYYYASKCFYITRKISYKSFTNVVRQICKHNNIMFNSSIKYNESKYNIVFYIYF